MYCLSSPHSGGGAGAGEQQERRELEHGLTFSMLGVRVAEMRAAWLDNQHDLQAALIQVEESVGQWMELAVGLARRAEELTAMHQALHTLKEAEVSPGHRLHSLLEPYRRHRAVEAAATTARKQVGSFTGECERMAGQQGRALASITAPQLARWGAEVGQLAELAAARPSSATVREFLEGAGQRELLAQYCQLEQEVKLITKYR